MSHKQGDVSKKLFFEKYNTDTVSKSMQYYEQNMQDLLATFDIQDDIDALKYISKSIDLELDHDRFKTYAKIAGCLGIGIEKLEWGSNIGLQDIKNLFDTIGEGEDKNIYIVSSSYETGYFGTKDKIDLLYGSIKLRGLLLDLQKNIKNSMITIDGQSDIDSTNRYIYCKLQLEYITILLSNPKLDTQSILAIYIYLYLFLHNKKILPHSSGLSQYKNNRGNTTRDHSIVTKLLPTVLQQGDITDNIVGFEKRKEMKNVVQNIL